MKRLISFSVLVAFIVVIRVLFYRVMVHFFLLHRELTSWESRAAAP